MSPSRGRLGLAEWANRTATPPSDQRGWPSEPARSRRAGLVEDGTRCGPDDRHDEHQGDEVADVVEEPGPPQQLDEEAALVVTPEDTRKLEARRAHQAHDDHGYEDHAEEAAEAAYLRKNSTSSRPVPYPPAMMIDWKTNPGRRYRLKKLDFVD